MLMEDMVPAWGAGLSESVKKGKSVTKILFPYTVE